jgi:hypothetical protein
MFSRLAAPLTGGCGGFEESFTLRLACLGSVTVLDLECKGLTKMSIVWSTMLEGLVALLGAVEDVVLLTEPGTVISLESRKGLVEIGLTALLSVTRLRKGFLDARDGPRSVASMSVVLQAEQQPRGGRRGCKRQTKSTKQGREQSQVMTYRPEVRFEPLYSRLLLFSYSRLCTGESATVQRDNHRTDNELIHEVKRKRSDRRYWKGTSDRQCNMP